LSSRDLLARHTVRVVAGRLTASSRRDRELPNAHLSGRTLGASIGSAANLQLVAADDPRVLKFDYGNRIAKAGQNLTHGSRTRVAETTAFQLNPHARPVEERLAVPELQLAARRNRQPVEVIAD